MYMYNMPLKQKYLIGGRTQILYRRQNRIWWLHYWGYGNAEIELSEYP